MNYLKKILNLNLIFFLLQIDEDSIEDLGDQKR